jgi:L-threonylcarbamoyladenylate synthase
VLDLSQAVEAFDRGRVVVIPTDTVYGLAAMPGIPSAVAELFRIKGRAPTKPVAILAGSIRVLSWVGRFDEQAHRLAESFWPGPLTMIVPRTPGFEVDLGSGEGVGVRVPDAEITLELLGLTGPLAVTSANKSGAVPATTIDEAKSELGEDVQLFVDGGRCAGDPSTVVSLLGGTPQILREGSISFAQINAALEK